MLFGSPGSSRMSGGVAGRTPSRSQILGRQYQPFSNPFFDLASTYTPPSVKSLFAFCRFYYLTHGVIHAIVTKASEYPITDIIFQHNSPQTVRRWEELMLDHINYRTHQFETNLDYFNYGNAFVSPSYPFRKMLKCGSCRAEVKATDSRSNWKYINHRFWLSCPKCGQSSFADVEDVYYPVQTEINLIRWNPENVSIFYNEATGRRDYALELSASFRSQITMGRKDLVATTPQIFLDAVAAKRSIVFNSSEIFHMRRPAASSADVGWGVPLLMPVLKDAFYMQVLKKAQECVHPDTLIDTSTGLLRADEVREGSLVRTHTGAFREITARSDRSMREGERAYNLTVTGLRQLSATFSETHPVKVLRRNQEKRRVDTKEQQRSSVILRDPHLYEWQWVQAQDVRAGDYLAFPTSRENETGTVDLSCYGDWSAVTDSHVYLSTGQPSAEEFEAGGDGTHGGNARKIARQHLRGGTEPKRLARTVELSEDLAYVAGWYAGDGCSDPRRIIFCMGPDDDGLELQAAIQRCFPFTTFTQRPSKKSRGWNLEVYGSAFARFLGAWIPGTAHTKRVPAEIRTAPDSVVAAFIKGYLEADGHDRGAQIAVGSASLQLAYDVWALGTSLGCIGTLTQRHCYDSVITNALGEEQHIEAGGNLHNYVVWSTRSAQRLRALMADEEAPEVISGKSGFFFKGYFAGRVLSAEEVPCERVIDFEVDTDHTFCVPGFVVHNSVMLTHLLPQVFLFPQPATGGADPFTATHLEDWRNQLRREIARQRADPSYYGIVPFPVGHQTIGENGKSLLLMPEIQQLSEQIVVGMGFSPGLVFGNEHFAGSSVSMRMLENFFLSNVHSHKRLLAWTQKKFGAMLGWPVPTSRFKPFRMADDIQRQGLLFQLNQAGKLSDTTLLSAFDIKHANEHQQISDEIASTISAAEKRELAQAEVQGRVMVVQAKYQAQAQQAMADAQAQQKKRSPFENMQQNGVNPPGASLDAIAAALAQKVRFMPEDRKRLYMSQLQEAVPGIGEMVEQNLEGPGMPQAPPQDFGGVDMRPEPEMLPPRR